MGLRIRIKIKIRSRTTWEFTSIITPPRRWTRSARGDDAVPADNWGNPSSVHHVGRHARALLDEPRERAATSQCRPSEIVFTSGGTESANAAVFGTARLRQEKGKHLVTSAVEHHAVLHSFNYLANKRV